MNVDDADILSEMSVSVLNSNEHLSCILREVINALGFGRAKLLRSTDEAWDELRAKKPPDMLVTEIELSDGCGLDFVRQVRTDPDSPNQYMPVVVVTARAERRSVMASINAGAHEFVALPISARILYPRLWNAAIVGRPFARTDDYFGPCRRRYDDPYYKGPERRRNDHRRAAENAVKEFKTQAI